MSTLPDAVAAAPPTPRHRRWEALRGGLAVAWLALVLVGFAVADRPASWEELTAAVARGEVERVTLTDSDQARTYRWSGLEAHWDGHVTQLTKRHLRELEASVVEVDREWRTGLHVDLDDVRGWQVPDWVQWAAVLLSIATLFLLVRGPSPWHATRWAWFWVLAMLPWLGLPLLLLFSGPTPRLSRGPVAPWLTGGWAFVFSLALGAVLDASF